MPALPSRTRRRRSLGVVPSPGQWAGARRRCSPPRRAAGTIPPGLSRSAGCRRTLWLKSVASSALGAMRLSSPGSPAPSLPRLCLLPLALHRRLLVARAVLHLLEQALLQHLLPESFQRGLDLIVHHLDPHGSPPTRGREGR